MEDQLSVLAELKDYYIRSASSDGASNVFHAFHAKVSGTHEVDGGAIGTTERDDRFR